MAWRRPGDKPLSEPIMVSLLTHLAPLGLNELNQVCLRSLAHICLIKSQWITWWRHQMETFSALLAICAGTSPVPGEFPAQRPVTRSFDVFYDLRSNERLRKQWRGWWFEKQSCPLWRHRNNYQYDDVIKKKYFPRYRPFVRGIHRSPVNSPHKGQWRGALMLSLVCA